MATKMSAFPHYPESAVVPVPGLFKSRFLDMDCVYSTSIPFSRRMNYRLCFFHVELSSSVKNSRRTTTTSTWRARSSLDNGSPPGNGTTRLIKAAQDFQIKLNKRISKMRKGFPMKVLSFLVGFYCATAFATVIGQTGDWDILSAGLAVVVVEGIGALMYKASFPLLNKIKSLITVFNYWKAGLSMGLFLDAFKYDMGDNVFGLSNPLRFDFDIHVFPTFL